MFSLYRTRDSAGDSGGRSDLLIPIYDSTNKVIDVKVEHNAKPAVGGVMRVGSNYTRSYSASDWWQTTLITEILEDKIESNGVRIVRFKTTNSEYIWKGKV